MLTTLGVATIGVIALILFFVTCLCDVTYRGAFANCCVPSFVGYFYHMVPHQTHSKHICNTPPPPCMSTL
jgi:hypothetical protein